jgi:hypothetical protein
MYPRQSETKWNQSTMPIAHPYVTLTVHLSPNPLTTYMEHKVIKATCNRIFCSYDNKKYDHTFYLHYDEGTRWSKTISAIKKGDMKVHVSGFYLGYPQKNNDSPFFEAIQLTELDYETKPNKYTRDDDDDEEEFFFRSSSNKNKKHPISTSFKSEPAISSSDESISSTEKREKQKSKKIKKSDDSTTMINSLSYDNFSTNKAIKHNKDDNKQNPSDSNLSTPKKYDNTYPPMSQNTSYYPHDDPSTQQHSHLQYPYFNPYFTPPPNSYYNPYHSPYVLPPHPPLRPPPHPQPSYHVDNSNETRNINDETHTFHQSNKLINDPTTTVEKNTIIKESKSVKFEEHDNNENNNDLSDHEVKKSNRKVRGKRGGRGGARGAAIKPTRVLRNRKKGIMDIAVDKIIEISEEDTMQISDDQKKESFMETEDELEY